MSDDETVTHKLWSAVSDNDDVVHYRLFESICELIDREQDLMVCFSALVNATALLILENGGNSPEKVRCLLGQISAGLDAAVANNLSNLLLAGEFKEENKH